MANPAQKLFIFNTDLLEEYPELSALQNEPIEKTSIDALMLGAVYMNLQTIERHLPNVEMGLPSINILCHIEGIKECLADLSGNKIYEKFVAGETKKYESLVRKAFEIINGRDWDPLTAIYR